jgi:hypothetical protein
MRRHKVSAWQLTAQITGAVNRESCVVNTDELQEVKGGGATGGNLSDEDRFTLLIAVVVTLDVQGGAEQNLCSGARWPDIDTWVRSSGCYLSESSQTSRLSMSCAEARENSLCASKIVARLLGPEVRIVAAQLPATMWNVAWASKTSWYSRRFEYS